MAKKSKRARAIEEKLAGNGQYTLEDAVALLKDVSTVKFRETVEVAINLGGAYVMQGRYAEAVRVLEEASRIEPDNAMLWMNLAAAYLGPLESSDEEGQLKAVAAFERALALDPEAPSVNYNLGLIYKQRGEAERAAAHFWRALEVDPSDSDARSRLRQLGYENTQPPDR